MVRPDFVLCSKRVLGATGIGPASMHNRNGGITALGSFGDVPPGWPVFDALLETRGGGFAHGAHRLHKAPHTFPVNRVVHHAVFLQA